MYFILLLFKRGDNHAYFIGLLQRLNDLINVNSLKLSQQLWVIFMMCVCEIQSKYTVLWLPRSSQTNWERTKVMSRSCISLHIIMVILTTWISFPHSQSFSTANWGWRWGAGVGEDVHWLTGEDSLAPCFPRVHSFSSWSTIQNCCFFISTSLLYHEEQ